MDRASRRHIGWKAGAALVALSILVGLLAGVGDHPARVLAVSRSSAWLMFGAETVRTPVATPGTWRHRSKAILILTTAKV